MSPSMRVTLNEPIGFTLDESRLQDLPSSHTEPSYSSIHLPPSAQFRHIKWHHPPPKSPRPPHIQARRFSRWACPKPTAPSLQALFQPYGPPSKACARLCHPTALQRGLSSLQVPRRSLPVKCRVGPASCPVCWWIGKGGLFFIWSFLSRAAGFVSMQACCIGLGHGGQRSKSCSAYGYVPREKGKKRNKRSKRRST